MLDCWPHLDCKSREKKALLNNRDQYDRNIKTQQGYLSQARSVEQFEALAELVTHNWATNLEEPKYAQWLESEYLTEPWDLWYYSVSGCPGVVPNQNPIEAHHHAIKATAVNPLRASTGHVLASTLPRALVACAIDIGQGSIRYYASGPVSSDHLEKALDLCVDDNHYPRHQGEAQRSIDKIDKYYFNAEYNVVRDDNENGLRVSAARTKLYQRSLYENLRAREEVQNVQLRYLLLHMVEKLARIEYDHHWDAPSWSLEDIKTILQKFRCDCKLFCHNGWLCEHILACLHLVDGLDLAVMLRELTARKPPGRPRKKCLARDGVCKSQYSIEALIRRLVEKPASVIDWSVVVADTTTGEDEEVTERLHVAKVNPPPPSNEEESDIGTWSTKWRQGERR